MSIIKSKVKYEKRMVDYVFGWMKNFSCHRVLVMRSNPKIFFSQSPHNESKSPEQDHPSNQ